MRTRCSPSGGVGTEFPVVHGEWRAEGLGAAGVARDDAVFRGPGLGSSTEGTGTLSIHKQHKDSLFLISVPSEGAVLVFGGAAGCGGAGGR